MPRIRTVKPEYWTDEKVVKLSAHARLLFLGLLNFADDEGYLWEEPVSIKLRILPLDNVDCRALLNQLVEAGMLVRYAADGGKVALHVCHFGDHQKVSHPVPSKIFPHLSGILPNPPELFGTFAPEGNGIEGIEGNGIEGKGREGRAPEKFVETEKKEKAPPRKRQIPDNYTPSDKMIRWAKENHPTVDALAETAQFYDYHRARASTMVDWEAAWRTWIRKAEAYAKSGRKGHKPYSDSDEWGVA